MPKDIATPVEGYVGNPDNLGGTGGDKNPFVPGAPAPAGGSPPFKGLEPINDSTRGLNIIGPGTKNKV